MKTQQLTSNAESRMAVERESLTQTIQVMLKTFTIWLMLMPISFIAQIQVGTDVQNAVTILMNTDSVYSQNRSYGWLKFNANTTNNISGNIFNIKAVVIRTPVSATTVKVRIVNLYDNGLNLIASDTLHTGDTLMVFTASVSANQWYYLQTIANYPCDTCVYNETVSFEMKLMNNEQIQCVPNFCWLHAYFFDPSTPFYYPYTICYSCQNTQDCFQPYIYPNFTGGGNQGGVGIGECQNNPQPCGTISNYCLVSSINSGTLNSIGTAPPDFSFNISCQSSIPNTQYVILCEDENTLVPIPYATTGNSNPPKNSFTICEGTPIYLYAFDNCLGIHTPTNSPLCVNYGTFQVTTNIGVFSYPANATPYQLNLPSGVTDFTIHYITCLPYYSYPSYCSILYGHIIPSPTVNVNLNTNSICLGSNNICFYYDNVDPNYSYTTSIIGPSYNQTFTGSYTSSNPMCLNNITSPGTYTLSTFVTFNYANITPGTSFYCKDTFFVTKTFTVSNFCLNINPTISSYGKQNINLINCTLVANGAVGAIPFTSLVSGNSYFNQNIAIPASGVIDGVFTIEGSLVISTPITFNNTDFAFREGASVIQNASMVIQNSYWHACKSGCIGMWKGIISNNSLNIQHSFIEDAQTAVQTNIPNHPGVSLNDVLFNKNYTAVSIGNTINASSLNNFRVTNCIFTSRQMPSPTSAQLTSTLLWRNIPPYTLTNLNTAPTGLLLGSTILGIPNTIRSQNGITFQLAKFSNNTPLVVGQWTNNHTQINIFDHLGNSAVIGVMGSNFRLIDNYFNNFLTGPDPAGALHKAVTVALSSNATVGYSPYQSFSAMTNTFVACLTGVYATANASLTVTNNSFVSNSIGVEIDQLGQNNQINYVVKNQFQNCNFDVKSTNNKAILLQVNDNTSTYTPPALSKLVPVYNVYAIEPSISALVGYTVNGNDFRGKRVGGVYFQNIAKSYISSNYIEMVPSVGGNNYVSNIGLENTQNISVTDNTLTCNPSSTSNWNNFGVLNSFGQNNEFCGNQINKLGICMKHQGTSPSIITNNIFNNNTSDKALIGIWLALNGFIGDIEYNTANIQHAPAGNIFGNKKMPLSTQYDFQIADTYVSNFSTASKIYINSFPLFNNLYIPLVNSYDPASCSNLPPTCSPFSVISSSYPNQFATCVNLPNTLKISPGVPQFINNPSAIHYDPNVRRAAEKSVFEFIRKNSINTNGFPNANNFMITENTSAHGTFITMDSLAQLYVKTSNPALITQAKNLNNAINPQYPSDFTQKNFNEVYLTFLQNDSLINTTHIDTLRSIAGRCPFTHGTAVYQARALLSKYDTLAYYNGCEITNITNNHRLMSQMVEEDESLLPLMLYPNPTKEYVAVYAPKYSVMYLMDITGKVVLQTEMKETTSRLVDIKNLSNGIYLYKIIKDDRVLKTDKLVIMGNE